MLKILIGIAVSMVVTGCATTASMGELEEVAGQTVAIDKCYTQNFMDADTAAQGKYFLNAGLSRTRYDHAAYEAYVKNERDTLSVSEAKCKEFTLVIKENSIREQKRAMQPTYDYVPPTQTSCETTGRHTTCTTY